MLRERERYLPLQLAALLSVAMLTSVCHAQDRAASGPWGLVGFAGVGEVEGIGLDLQLGWHSSNLFIGGRLMTASELDLMDWNGSDEPRSLFELGPIIGLKAAWRFLQAHIYSGVSYVSGEWYDDSASRNKQAVGVSLGTCGMLAVSRTVSIGFSVFQDFNNVQTYSGGALVVAIWK